MNDATEFSWTVREYSELSKKKGVSVSSPIFPDVRRDFRAEWQLILYPGGRGNYYDDVTMVTSRPSPYSLFGRRPALHSSACEDFAEVPVSVSIYLKMARCNYTAVAAKFTIDFRSTASGTLCAAKTCESANFSIMEKQKGWRDMTTGIQIDKHDLKDDTVTILCTVHAIELKGEPLDTFYTGYHSISQLWPFYEQGKFTDFTIVAGGKTFHVHKVLLAARSPVMAAMFDHDMEESAKNRIEILDFDAKTVENFVKFVYNVIAVDFRDTVKELLVLADKYDVKPLMAACEKSLVRDINTRNVLALLQLADAHRAKLLKESSLKFIKENINVVITDSDAEWDLLPRSLIKDFIKSLFPEKFTSFEIP